MLHVCSSNTNELTLTYTRRDAAHASLHMLWTPCGTSADRYNEYCNVMSKCTTLHAPWLGASAPLEKFAPILGPMANFTDDLLVQIR